MMGINDLIGKKILVSNKSELMSMLVYFELNGIKWIDGSKATGYIPRSLPTLLRFKNGNLGCDYNPRTTPDIHFSDLKSTLNWYKLLKGKSGSLYLHHIISKKNLMLTDNESRNWEGSIFNFDMIVTKNHQSVKDEEYVYKSTKNVRLYRGSNNNKLYFHLRGKDYVEVNKSGFDYIDWEDVCSKNEITEIGEVKFKRTVI